MTRRLILAALPLLLAGCGDPSQDHLSSEDIARSERAAAEEVTTNYAEDVNAVAPAPDNAAHPVDEALANVDAALDNAAPLEPAEGIDDGGSDARNGIGERVLYNEEAQSQRNQMR